MTEEATLADYTSADEAGSEDDPERPASAAEPEEETGPDAADDPEPAEPIYGWGSYDCARCGSGTDRVWRGEGGLVCSDCKEW